MDCSQPGFSLHGILQARVLESVAISLSKGSSQPTSPTLQADSLPSEPPRKPKSLEEGDKVGQKQPQTQLVK